MTLITGSIGIAMLVVFLGILVWWIQAAPLIIIIAAVLVLMVYDFVQTIREDERGA